MKDVKIYTWSYCPYCKKAKALLDSLGVNYTEEVIDGDDEKREALSNITGIKSVPHIFVADKFIGGSDDLHKLHESGKLREILG